MINLSQIQRLVEAGDFGHLVDRILANGRCPNLTVRMTLSDRAIVEPAALGLALQRVNELTYGPTAIAEAIAAHLMHRQGPDGLFHSDGETPTGDDPVAATAIAVRALLSYLDLQRETGIEPDPRLAVAADRGLSALSQRQSPEGGVGADGVDAAIVLWQLGDRAEFRQAVRLFDLVEAVETSEHGVEIDDLWRLAHAAAA